VNHHAFWSSLLRLIYPLYSCSPNAYLTFDYATFSATLCALRDIRDGEEITITYIPDLTPAAAKRQNVLGHFGFDCKCASCTNPSSEEVRCIIVQNAVSARAYALSQSLTGSDATRVDDESMLLESVRWIGVIEKEGLHVLREYEAHLTAAATASLRLSNSEDHAKYMTMAEAWRRVVLGSSMHGDDDPARFQQSLFRVYAS
jgi:hypothetical protein